MDATSLLTGLVSASNIKKISSASGASSADVKNVLTQALPVMLQGATSQSSGSSAASFAQALTDHAGAKTGSAIDIADGAKIVSHLLGKKESSATASIAKAAGVSKDSTASILSAAAPLFMSLLGKQSAGSSGNALTSLLSGLSSNINVGNLAASLLGGSTGTASTSSSSSSGKKKKDGADLVGGIMNLLK